MPAQTLDVRDLPPAERHDTIREAFDDLDSGEELLLINDHEPTPLFYEFREDREERESFDVDRYRVEQRGEAEFLATLPKE